MLVLTIVYHDSKCMTVCDRVSQNIIFSISSSQWFYVAVSSIDSVLVREGLIYQEGGGDQEPSLTPPPPPSKKKIGKKQQQYTVYIICLHILDFFVPSYEIFPPKENILHPSLLAINYKHACRSYDFMVIHYQCISLNMSPRGGFRNTE